MRLSSVLPTRYSPSNLARAWRNPALLRIEAIHWATRANAATTDLLRSLSGCNAGIDVVAADWDNLLILDGCRYDLFEARSPLEGELEAVRSKASHSGEFMEANFAGRTLHDSVYVTANPFTYELDDGTFHAVENLLDTHWDESTQTVLPEDVVEATRRAHERYPDKRLLVHFMQPHFPFLGPTGRAFDHQGIDMHVEAGETDAAVNPWNAFVYDDRLDFADVKRAYRENFDLVMPHVAELLAALSGKSVVTADHGNLLGERGWPVPLRLYGHPRGSRQDGVRVVPWFTVPGEERRTIVAEPPVEADGDAGADGDGADTAGDAADAKGDASDDVVDERLRALGYV